MIAKNIGCVNQSHGLCFGKTVSTAVALLTDIIIGAGRGSYYRCTRRNPSHAAFCLAKRSVILVACVTVNTNGKAKVTRVCCTRDDRQDKGKER
jgi:hypothetical protein